MRKNLEKLTKYFDLLAGKLSDERQDILSFADKLSNDLNDPEILKTVKVSLKIIYDTLSSCVDILEAKEKALYEAEEEHSEPFNTIKMFPSFDPKNKEASYNLEDLEALAILANEFDKSGDIELQKQASVLDDILLSIAAKKSDVAEAKRAQDKEIEKLKAMAAKDEKEVDKVAVETNPYKRVKKEQDRENGVEAAEKAIKDSIKEYRILEAPLQTRTCPDHPGAQMGRIAEHTFQCSLDKGIYNYQSGYIPMKGNTVPGGDVAGQTQSFLDRPNEFTSFETRESILNRF